MNVRMLIGPNVGDHAFRVIRRESCTTPKHCLWKWPKHHLSRDGIGAKDHRILSRPLAVDDLRTGGLGLSCVSHCHPRIILKQYGLK